MVFLLSKRCEILYGTTKIQKKISTGTQNLYQSHTIQYIKLKKMVISKWEIWLRQRFSVPVEIFFWIFVVPYKISHPFDYKNTIWLKIYPCFWSQITTCNLPTWPGEPCMMGEYKHEPKKKWWQIDLGHFFTIKTPCISK